MGLTKIARRKRIHNRIRKKMEGNDLPPPFVCISQQ
jgi:hypothetical protein